MPQIEEICGNGFVFRREAVWRRLSGNAQGIGAEIPKARHRRVSVL
jgi:hypothetical protein